MRTSLLLAAVMALASAGCRRDVPADVPAASARPSAPAVMASRTGPATATGETGKTVADDHAAINASIDIVLGDHAKYERAIVTFQSAIAGNDRAAVAGLVAYPFIARIAGKALAIADADAFVARYDDIVTPAIAAAITSQEYAALFVNARGVMFGNGEAWINGICRNTACTDVDVKVVAIQPPPP